MNRPPGLLLEEREGEIRAWAVGIYPSFYPRPQIRIPPAGPSVH